MRTQPTDLSLSLLRDTVIEHWGLTDPQLTYLPLGFGSHHWNVVDAASGERWFATVDDHRNPRMVVTPAASLDALRRAMRTAAALHDEAGLAFVLAPTPNREGGVLRSIGATAYSIVLFPYVEGTSAPYGAFASEADRLETLRLVGRVHAATGLVPEGLPRRETFLIPRREDLFVLLDDLEAPWESGPYAEGARDLLRANRGDILRAFVRYDALVAAVEADPEPWVVTQGEPHAGNILRTTAGMLLLVDWDTCMLGPKERDLWMLDEGPATDWTVYLEETGATTVSRRVIDLYRMWWDLCEISEFASWFRAPHEATEDTAIGWNALNGYLPIDPAYLELAG
ncbi:MAG TPA: phosphotransferase [Thermomicrobiales bacterium]|nr:phosphotransferase [Thermomicrobiales bacterium]